jgi:Mg2+-importing ATPase
MTLSLPTESFFWRSSPEEVLIALHSSHTGLAPAEITAHHTQFGPNSLVKKKVSFPRIMIRQLTGNPLIIILTVATMASYFLGQQVNSYYIFTMILLSIGLGFWNEYSTAKTVESLLKNRAR